MGRVAPRPQGCNILVKPMEGEEMTASGLLLPPEIHKRSDKGMIVACGPGCTVVNGTEKDHLAMDLKPGDMIVWDKREGVGVRINDEELVVLTEHDVLVVLEDE